ncbi:TasA family protein [Haloferax massiliensis]|uniref:Camelysin metallo-endopeptidase n=1 Tax=Haloferax massiliensis TaxID=1476858 RepID=A0A0D6JVD4_9EURY|nr:TasA family protein [Haloferax massiliensis]CQR52223.1 Camelysin metallo-endopeptidase [Haloferax massiliensis]
MPKQTPTLTLTRRRFLGGLFTISAGSAAAGVGTYSAFSDTERADASFGVGTLDLTVDGDDEQLTFLEESGLAPGDSGTASVTLRNRGSLTGFLDIDVLSVTDDENGQSEPPSQNDPRVGDGELAQVLEVRAWLEAADGSKTYLCGSSDYATLDSIFVADETFDLDYELAPGESVDFVIAWRLPSSAGNEVASDVAGVDLRFALDQRPDADDGASCEVDDDDGGDDGSTSGTGDARDAMGGWDWATLARYGEPYDGFVYGNSEPENYEVAVLKRSGSSETRLHRQNSDWQHAWWSGRTESFRVDFDGSKVTMTVGGTEYPDKHGWKGQGVGANDVVALGVTVSASAAGSSVAVSDLELTAAGQTSTLADVSVDATGTNHVRIDREIDGSFSLTGTLQFSWHHYSHADPDDLVMRVDVKTGDAVRTNEVETTEEDGESEDGEAGGVENADVEDGAGEKDQDVETESGRGDEAESEQEDGDGEDGQDGDVGKGDETADSESETDSTDSETETDSTDSETETDSTDSETETDSTDSETETESAAPESVSGDDGNGDDADGGA